MDDDFKKQIAFLFDQTPQWVSPHTHFFNLPQDLLFEILQRLDWKDRKSLRQVNELIHSVMQFLYKK